MDWSDVGRAIIKIGAPILGTAVGGPAGGALATIIASQFGADPSNPSDVFEKMIDDPEASIKLLQIQSDERISLERINTENLRIAHDEKESARRREVEIAKTGKKDNTPAILAYILTVGFFTFLGLLVFVSIPLDERTVLDVMTGVLGTAWLESIRYFFGSSAGSKSKDELIYKR